MTVFGGDHEIFALLLPTSIEFCQFVVLGQFFDLFGKVFRGLRKTVGCFGEGCGIGTADGQLLSTMIALEEIRSGGHL